MEIYYMFYGAVIGVLVFWISGKLFYCISDYFFRKYKIPGLEKEQEALNEMKDILLSCDPDTKYKVKSND